MRCYKGVHEQGPIEFEFFDDSVGQESGMIKDRNEIDEVRSEYPATTLNLVFFGLGGCLMAISIGFFLYLGVKYFEGFSSLWVVFFLPYLLLLLSSRLLPFFLPLLPHFRPDFSQSRLRFEAAPRLGESLIFLRFGGMLVEPLFFENGGVLYLDNELGVPPLDDLSFLSPQCWLAAILKNHFPEEQIEYF